MDRSLEFQDPYIRLTLHDGQYNLGGIHHGETIRTATKDNAGGSATFNEVFKLNKPGVSFSLCIGDSVPFTDSGYWFSQKTWTFSGSSYMMTMSHWTASLEGASVQKISCEVHRDRSMSGEPLLHFCIEASRIMRSVYN